MEYNLIQVEKSLTPTGEENIFQKIDSYSCTLCSSQIEILSLESSDSETKITFKCLNNDIKNNHGINTMLLDEYLKEMEKNIYISFKCQICQKKQNSNFNNKIFNFCINCKMIICDNCLNKHQNNKNKHTLIKTNEINIKCLNHNSEFNSYCFDCKKQLCKQCLKDRTHLSHKKSIIDEAQLSKEEKENFDSIINSLKEKKKLLENEHKNYITNLNIKLSNDKNDILNKYNLQIIKNNKELEDNLIKEKNNMLKILEELKQKYENDKKNIEDNYNLINKSLNEKYKMLIKNETIKKDENLKNIQKIFEENINNLQTKKYLDIIKNQIKLNEIIKTFYLKYPNNYNNNINAIHSLNYYKTNQLCLKPLEDKKNLNQNIGDHNNEIINRIIIEKDMNVKVEEIYNDLEEKYFISDFKQEDEVKEMIRKFGCNKDKIEEWVETIMW